MARRIPTLARYINEHVAGLTAHVEKGYNQPQRKLFGRVSWFGKEQVGNRLIVHVTGQPGWVLVDHNATEPYRCNQEIEDFIGQWEERGWLGRFRWYTRKQVLRGEPWK